MQSGQPLKWQELFILNVPKIDSEHKIFFDLIAQLQEAVPNVNSSDFFLRLLLEIESYARFHFISEENFMLRIGYPGTQRHIKLHEELLENLAIEKIKYVESETTIFDFLRFLYDWFANHTVKEDRKFADYIFKQEKSANF